MNVISKTDWGRSFGLLGKGILFLSLSLFLLPALVAQTTGTGTVTGQVLNRGTNLYLEGARVEVEGTNLVTYTNRGGEYRLTNVPAGSHTLVVTYTGLDTTRLPVRVSTGQVTRQQVGLTAQVYEMDEVTVAGIREGSALAITLQRQAPNIKHVAAIDQFGAPAANPGELLQRLPGVAADPVGAEIRQIRIRGLPPAASSMMIDGNRTTGADSASVHRWVPVDSLATYNLERVELIKAPTPDMDADAIGGFVNLVSKKAFDRPPGRYISFSLGTLFYDRPGDSPERDAPGLDMATLGYSEVFSVFGGENNLGVSLNAGYRKSYTLSDQVWNTFLTGGRSTADVPTLQNSIQSREFVAPTYRPSFGASIDYKLSDITSVSLKLDANRKQSYQVYRGWRWGGGNSAGNYQPGWSYDYTESKPTNASRYTIFSGDIASHNYNYTFTPRVEHDWGDLKLDWGGFYSYSSAWYPTRTDFQADIRRGAFAIDRRDPDRHDWYPEFTQISGPDIYDIQSYVPSNLAITRNQAKNRLWGFNADVRKDFDLAVPAFVKAGVRIRDEQNVRDWNVSRYLYVGPDRKAGTADDADLSIFLDPDYTYATQRGRYAATPIFTVPGSGKEGDIQELFKEHPEYFDQDYYYSIQQGFRNDGEVSEQVSGGYFMGNVDIGKVSILGGLRVEKTEIDALGPVNTPTNLPATTDEEEIAKANAEWGTFDTRQSEYRNVFPGVHFRYEAAPGLLVRASYSTGIARAHKNNFISSLNVNEEDQRVSLPNPGLEPQFSDNFDVSLEYYFEPVGVFSIGAFLKEMDNFLFREEFVISGGADNGFGGEYAGWTGSIQRNGGFARIRGYEVNFEQQFSWLPGFWSGFGLTANYTKLQTKGNYGGTRVVTAIPQFTPENANAGISYVNHGVQVRFLGTYRGRRLQTNSTNPAALQWLNSRTWFDFKFQYAVNRNMDLFVDVINIFDEPSQETEYGWGWARWRYLQGTQYSVGLRGRF